MHLLVRRISSYTEADRLLGAFKTVEAAEAARDSYLLRVVHGPSDPWAHQAYHEVTDGDVIIWSSIPEIDVSDAAERVFVVSSFTEGFGQIQRTIEAVVGSAAAAQRHAEEREARGDDHFPHECEVEELEVGVLRLDA